MEIDTCRLSQLLTFCTLGLSFWDNHYMLDKSQQTHSLTLFLDSLRALDGYFGWHQVTFQTESLVVSLVEQQAVEQN